MPTSNPYSPPNRSELFPSLQHSPRTARQSWVGSNLTPYRDLHGLRDAIRHEFQACRGATLNLFVDIAADDYHRFRQQAHPGFSPIGWHLGHIGYTESLWILERMAQQSPALPDYQVLFAQDGLPKTERQNLPAIAEVADYLADIRRRVFDYLEAAPVDHQLRLWWFLLQHESQHSETISIVHQLQTRSNFTLWDSRQCRFQPTVTSLPASQDMVFVPAGPLRMGNDNPVVALDNEGPSTKRHVDACWIDRFPVTCASYRQFMAAGGYRSEAWWSPSGWQWLQRHPVSQPLYWSDDPIWDDHPVYGVSWYEAEAYANFVGKRLPTESEWEKAARWSSQANQALAYPWGDQSPSPQLANYGHHIGHTTPVGAFPLGQSPLGCVDMLGNVWEWTMEHFDAYPNFKPYPYTGYSQTYFDRQHYVLRGGSWATQPWTLRSTFRNWYTPDVRQLFCGFRCAISC